MCVYTGGQPPSWLSIKEKWLLWRGTIFPLWLHFSGKEKVTACWLSYWIDCWCNVYLMLMSRDCVGRYFVKFMYKLINVGGRLPMVTWFIWNIKALLKIKIFFLMIWVNPSWENDEFILRFGWRYILCDIYYELLCSNYFEFKLTFLLRLLKLILIFELASFEIVSYLRLIDVDGVFKSKF